MKPINDFILEKEYKKIDEYWEIFFNENDAIFESGSSKSGGFWNWIKNLGKKFWKWLFNTDFENDDTNWGVRTKVKWIDVTSENLKKITEKTGFDECFPITSNICRKYPKVESKHAMNQDKVPTIIMTFLTEPIELEKRVSRAFTKFNRFKDRYHNIRFKCMVLGIETCTKTKEQDAFIFDRFVYQMFMNQFLNEFDTIFFSNEFMRSPMFKLIKSEMGVQKIDSNFFIIGEWDEIENYPLNTNDNADNNDNVNDNDDTADNTNADDDSGSDDITNNDSSDEEHEETTVNLLPEVLSKYKKSVRVNNITYKYIVNTDVIKSIIHDGLDEEDTRYVLIYDFEFNNSADNALNTSDKFKILKNEMSGRPFADEIRNILGINRGTYNINIILKMSKPYQNKWINVFDNNVIDSEDFDITWIKPDIDRENGIFPFQIYEALDVDNLFWMLDTWFGNNEKEKTAFMSIIDNCIIKRTYSKNSLAELCDNINLDIKPFINFMCKDATSNNKNEEPNIDYYYELKKIIDALISNKATNNKYVRFS